MLLDFKAENYKSFKEELIFSLVPAPKQKKLDYTVLKKNIGKKVYKGLCSAVIYGPNASGKTNIIGAMDTFKTIVLRGNIRNGDEKGYPNAAANTLQLIPNANDSSGPIRFSIRFTADDFLIEYSIALDIGKFLEVDYTRKVLSEKLVVNGHMIFSRNDNLEFGRLNNIKELLTNAFEQNADSAMALAIGNLDNEELFLMNGFKTMFSPKLVSIISDWLEIKFIVIYRADAVSLVQEFGDIEKKTAYVEKTLSQAAAYFGINSNALGYIMNDNNEAKLYSLFKDDKKGIAVRAELFESYGTIRFINLFPLVVNALLSGSTLVVDEFDASIHPMALMNIINIFHNDEINIHQAQLIFNTHNPIFLNSNLYRRDEIKFVERDEDTHYSSQYSLSDFGTAGSEGRNNADYMKNYFIDRYGAIKDIDFTPIFKELMSDKN